MKKFVSLMLMELKLSLRTPQSAISSIGIPMMILALNGTLMGKGRPEVIGILMPGVLVVGALAAGLFATAIPLVNLRERGMLRRFRLAPITPAAVIAAVLAAHIMLSLLGFAACWAVAIGYFHYTPPHFALQLLVYLVGSATFVAAGLILGSAASTTSGAAGWANLLFMPMLFLSGAAIPLEVMPEAVRRLAQFMPSGYFVEALRKLNGEFSALDLAFPLAVLAVSAGLLLAADFQLFRWDPAEKLGAPRLVKAALLGLAPVLIAGAGAPLLGQHFGSEPPAPKLAVVGAAVWGADDKVHPDQVLLLDDGKIRAMFAENSQPIPSGYRQVNARGGFVIPSLFDLHIHLDISGASGIELDELGEQRMRADLRRYAQLGVLGVRSVGDQTDRIMRLRQLSEGDAGEAQLFAVGPVLTAPGGHPTEYYQGDAKEKAVRELATADEAHAVVKDLSDRGVDGIKLVYDEGSKEHPYPRMKYAVMEAAIQEAHLHQLPVTVHTGSAAEVRDAVRAGADGVEHGATRDALPDDLIAELKNRGTFYDATLSVIDGFRRIAARDHFEDDPLAEGRVEPAWLQDLSKGEGVAKLFRREGAERQWTQTLAIAKDNVRRAALGGVKLVLGTDAGNVGSLHGIATHRELQLLHDAGVPTPVMLEAATENAADALKHDDIGRIAVGKTANLVVLGGDPLSDASAYDRIRFVVHRGHLIVHVP
jgi:imidazolonepropionase-like amidohydrolase/ABC-type transport system involved in cytochrome c biogenesis permease component